MCVLAALLMGGCSRGEGGDEPSPSQPDPSFARHVTTELAAIPGVAHVRTRYLIECIDGCQGVRYVFEPNVTLKPSANADTVRAVLVEVDRLYPGRLSAPWRQTPEYVVFRSSPASGTSISPAPSTQVRTGRSKNLTDAQANSVLSAVRGE